MAALRLPAGVPAGPLEFAILAHGTACLAPAEMTALRTEPLSGFPVALAPQLLKHSDEQTLASLVAVRRALAAGGLNGTDFSHWGVVSSSRYLGRSPFAAVLNKYKIDGPWGVSVQVIPHRMPHSVPGTISLALQNHGPSISVGGGPDDQTSALLSIAGLLRGGRFPGAWLVVSGWSPELTIDITGRVTSDSKCLAAAVAVTASCTGSRLGSLRFDAAGSARSAEALGSADSPADTSSLADFLLDSCTGRREWRCQFANGLEIGVDLTLLDAHEPNERRPAAIDCPTALSPAERQLEHPAIARPHFAARQSSQTTIR